MLAAILWLLLLFLLLSGCMAASCQLRLAGHGARRICQEQRGLRIHECCQAHNCAKQYCFPTPLVLTQVLQQTDSSGPGTDAQYLAKLTSSHPQRLQRRIAVAWPPAHRMKSTKHTAAKPALHGSNCVFVRPLISVHSRHSRGVACSSASFRASGHAPMPAQAFDLPADQQPRLMNRNIDVNLLGTIARPAKQLFDHVDLAMACTVDRTAWLSTAVVVAVGVTAATVSLLQFLSGCSMQCTGPSED